MRRIVIVGASGSGKTTLARALAAELDIEHIELDRLHHQADWQPRPLHELRDDLEHRLAAATHGWVTCGNYWDQTADITVPRCDTVVWIDLPRWQVMGRLVARTVRRAITREELWNGNREPLTNFYRWDPELNVIRWSWLSFPKLERRYRHLMTFHPWRDDQQMVRLRSIDEVALFLRHVR